MDPANIAAQGQANMGSVSAKVVTDWSDAQNVDFQRLRQLEEDSMKTSESASLAAYAAMASVPVITPPLTTNDSTVSGAEGISGPISTSSTDLKLFQAKLAADIAGAWAKSVQEASERRQDLENSPIYKAQEAYLRSLRNNEDPSAYTTAHSFTASLVIGATFTGYVGPTGRSESHISYNTTVDAMQQITPNIPGPGDMRAELGLIGATLAYGAVFQAAWIQANESVKPPVAGNKPNLQFATQYADRLIAQCKDPAFDTLLTTLITQHLEGSQPPSPEKMQEMIAMVKMGMLLSAAALFYQVDTGGGQTGLEVAGLLIDPNAPKLDPANPRAKLQSQFREYLAAIKNPETRQSVLEKVMAFLDDNKSVKSLTDPAEILGAIFGSDASINGGAVGIVAA